MTDGGGAAGGPESRRMKPRRVALVMLLVLVVLGGAWALRRSGDLDREIARAELEAGRQLGRDCLARVSEYSFGRAEVLTGTAHAGTTHFFRFGIRVASYDWVANQDYDRATEVLHWFHGGNGEPVTSRDLCAGPPRELKPMRRALRPAAPPDGR